MHDLWDRVKDAIVRENPQFTEEQAGIMVRDYLPEIIGRLIVGKYWDRVAADQVRKNHPAQLWSRGRCAHCGNNITWERGTTPRICGVCGKDFQLRNDSTVILLPTVTDEFKSTKIEPVKAINNHA